MQFKNLLSGCAVGLSVLVSAAHADPTCVATSGSIDPPTIVFSGGAWQISFTATGSANSSVLVTAASNEPIAFVQATTNSSGSLRTNLTVTAPSVASVSKVGGNGEFWVTGITTSGNIALTTDRITGAERGRRTSAAHRRRGKEPRERHRDRGPVR